MLKIKLNKRKTVALIFLSAFLVTLIVIWYLSGKTGYQSNVSTEKIARHIENFVSKYFSVNKRDSFWSTTLNELIRKAGHFTEYMLIGAFLGSFVFLLSKKLWMTILITGIGGPLLAYADELRQGMVAGRTPRTFDVQVDSAGVFLGLAVVCAVFGVLSYILRLKKMIKELEGKNE